MEISKECATALRRRNENLRRLTQCNRPHDLELVIVGEPEELMKEYRCKKCSGIMSQERGAVYLEGLRDAELPNQDAQVRAETVELSCGRLQINHRSPYNVEILLDGKPLEKVRRADVTFLPGEIPHVLLNILTV